MMVIGEVGVTSEENAESRASEGPKAQTKEIEEKKEV